MIIKRSRQLWHALNSEMTDKDITFVKDYLSTREQSLFFSMDRATQTHSVRVANTCLTLTQKDCTDININLLIRAALLHDIGKPAGIIRTLDRVFIVLVETLFPFLKKYLLNSQKCSLHLFKAYAAHCKHPAKGAELAKELGLEQEIITLIELHHSPKQREELPALTILRQADDLN